MNRDRASNIMTAYGKPHFKTKDHVISFARQTEEDLKEIESKTDDELVNHWKSLIYINEIAGHISLNELQRITLIELEFEERENINADDLSKWFEEESSKFVDE